MKPDDVSQEAWDAADLVFEFSIHSTVDYRKYRTTIARAIMAAKAEERSWIISIIERFSKVTKDPGHFEYEDRLMRGVLARVVDAINSRT